MGIKRTRGACKNVSKCKRHVQECFSLVSNSCAGRAEVFQNVKLTCGSDRVVSWLFCLLAFLFFCFFCRNLNLLVDIVVARTTIPKSKTHMRAVMNTSSHFSFLKRFCHRMILTLHTFLVAKRND